MKKTNIALGLIGFVGLILTSCSGSSTFDSSKAISKYSREAGSGTRECFFEGIGYKDVAKEDKWVDGVEVSLISANADMMSKVAGDEYALGYCSLDGLKGNDTVKAVTFEGIVASNETVVSGDYKLNRNFNYVVRDYSSATDTDSKNKEQVVKAFLEFLETSEGKTTIASKGGILASTSSSTKFDDIVSKYPVLSSTDAVELRTCGSTSVEKVVKALNEKFLSLIKNTNIKIEMNQTGSGDAVKGVTEGKNGVNSDFGYLSREISASELELLTDKNSKGTMCKDAVVVIVNNANTVCEDVSATTLASIYKGEIKTWAELAK